MNFFSSPANLLDTMTKDRKSRIKACLEHLYHTYSAAYLHTDPLRFLHQFSSREDQEVLGFLAASMAYGRVGQINATLERVLEVMDHRPARFVARFDPTRHVDLFDSIRHRFHTGRDIAGLVYAIRQMVDGWGSIERFFKSGSSVKRFDMGQRIEKFSERALKLDFEPFLAADGELSPGVRFTFPRPSSGSACKRLNLFLRWMVRRQDGLDLGIWRSIDPSELLIPLDVHVGRIAHALGLTRCRGQTWKAVIEVTDCLSVFDPNDPVKYDFSLCRLGILQECPTRRVPATCRQCQLKGLCRYSHRM